MEVGSKKNIKEQKLFENLLSLEIFNHLDRNYYLKTKKLESNFDLSYLKEKAGKNFEEIKSDHMFYKEIRRRKMFIHILLLEIIYLQFKYKKTDLDKKVELLLEFMHIKFNAIFLRLLTFAIKYFYADKGLAYLKSINKGMKNPVESIERLSWDLVLLYQLEEYTSIDPLKIGAFLPLIITMDDGFQQVIDSHKLKAIVKINDSFESIATDSSLSLLTQLVNTNQKIEYFFTDRIIQMRNIYQNLTRNFDFSFLLSEQENKVANILKI